MAIFNIFGSSLPVMPWWKAWVHYLLKRLQIDDFGLNAALISLVALVIILFLYKIKHMGKQHESPAFEAYRKRVRNSVKVAESLINAIEVIADFKKNSINAADYERIRRDCQSAEALLKYLSQKESQEYEWEQEQAASNVASNVGEYTCERTTRKSDDTNREHELNRILSETPLGEITLTRIPKGPKPIARLTRTPSGTWVRLPSPKISVRYTLPRSG